MTVDSTHKPRRTTKGEEPSLQVRPVTRNHYNGGHLGRRKPATSQTTSKEIRIKEYVKKMIKQKENKVELDRTGVHCAVISSILRVALVVNVHSRVDLENRVVNVPGYTLFAFIFCIENSAVVCLVEVLTLFVKLVHRRSMALAVFSVEITPTAIVVEIHYIDQLCHHYGL